jgi:hypothetical protein
MRITDTEHLSGESSRDSVGAGGGVRGWGQDLCNPCDSVVLGRFHSTNLRTGATYQEGYELVLIGASLCVK